MQNTIKDQIINEMTALEDEVQKKNLMRFFKTGKNQYGEGDLFLGLKNPIVRNFVKKYYKEIPLSQTESLIQNKFHEIRLCGFLILVEKYSKLSTKKDFESQSLRDEIINLYLKNSTYANNWDLVDLSAPKLFGKWFLSESFIDNTEKEKILHDLSFSENLWQRRISMVFTWQTTRQGHPEIALKQALIHLSDKHDLMRKAVGWMLREVGKVCSQDSLREFLEDNYPNISRTTLRYAIEKFEPQEREYWLRKNMV